MKINFFLNILSMHQAPLIRKLSERYKVTIYYENEISKARQDLGWYNPDFGNSKIYKLDYIDELETLKSMNNDTVNIFSGLDAYPKTYNWLNKSLKTSARNYIQMESLNLFGFKGLLRKVKYRLLSIKYNELISGIFTQGGRKQLESLGFKKVYDFAYFLDIENNTNEHLNSETRYIYLGALSKRKRILDLVSSIPSMSHIYLDLYGAELDVSIKQIMDESKNKKNIRYLGVKKNDEIKDILKNYDYLILPSKSEGWGAVVSEALLCGVGVIVSDVAGVTEYIENNFSNHVYIKDFSDMSDIYCLLKELPPLKPNERDSIQREAFFLSSDYGVKLLTEHLS